MREIEKDAKDEQEADEVTALRAPVVYTAIKREGEAELERPLLSLWWSGLAAGLAIFLSVVALGALSRYLEADGTPHPATHLGYCLGFIVVVFGRWQLFTENTVTAVLPLLTYRDRATLTKMVRLWGVVLVANILGVFLAAWATVSWPIFSEPVLEGMVRVSLHYIERDALTFFLQAIPAGFLIAAMVWAQPTGRGDEFLLVVALTYAISLTELTHVIAGSGELFIAMLLGHISVVESFTVSLLPTLAGNIIGGTVLFAMLAYGQVSQEVPTAS